MLTVLARIFIKDYKNYEDNSVREKYGILCGAVGIFLNFLLFIVKFILGSLSSSVAMVADGFNNLSDAASSIIQVIGFKLSSKKPDFEHPFGHGRLEYISGLVISFFVILMGVELFKSSVFAIKNPSKIEHVNETVIIMCGAILVKLYMYFYNHSISKKINSVVMYAAAVDSLGDMISNVVVIVSIVASKFTDFPVDGFGGIIVAVLILKTGYETAKETVMPLLGAAPDSEFVKSVEQEVLRHKPICGVHDLIIHDYGHGRVMISLHAEVPGNLSVFELHDVIDNAESDVSKKFNCNITIHMDPVDVNNRRLKNLKTAVKEEVEKISPELKAHDIRMSFEKTHTDLIFDLVKPFGFKLTDEDIKTQLNNAIRKRFDGVNCVITVEQPFS